MAKTQEILTKEESGKRVTLTEASKLTGIEPLIIINHIEEGRLNAIRTGNRYSIDLSQLKEYACCLYDSNTGVKMYNPFVCFDANTVFYL